MKKAFLILLLISLLTVTLVACSEGLGSVESVIPTLEPTSTPTLKLTPTSAPEPTLTLEPTQLPTQEEPVAARYDMTEADMTALFATLTEPPSEALQTAYGAYFDILAEAVEEYGYVDDIDGYSGVVHAELIDFNNDGVPELLYFYLDNTQEMEILTKLRVYGYSNGIVLHYSSFFHPNHESFGIATGRDGLLYLCYREYDSYAISHSYYSVVLGRWKQVLALSWVEAEWDDNLFAERDEGREHGQEINYYINGNSVSELAYDNALESELGSTNIRILWDWWGRCCGDWFFGNEHDYQECAKCLRW